MNQYQETYQINSSIDNNQQFQHVANKRNIIYLCFFLLIFQHFQNPNYRHSSQYIKRACTYYASPKSISILSFIIPVFLYQHQHSNGIIEKERKKESLRFVISRLMSQVDGCCCVSLFLSTPHQTHSYHSYIYYLYVLRIYVQFHSIQLYICIAYKIYVIEYIQHFLSSQRYVLFFLYVFARWLLMSSHI